MSRVKDIRAIEAHYEKRIGSKYAYGRDYQSVSGPEFAVLQWPESCPWGVHVYATLGAHQLNCHNGLGREYYIGLNQACDGMDDSLAKLAIENFGRQKRPSVIGDTIELREPICFGSQITGLMTVDIGATFIPILKSGASVVDFQKLIPVYVAEIDLKRSQGYEALLTLLEERSADYTDPLRPPMA